MAKPMLSDEQWAKLEPLLPKYSSAGRPWKENRAVLEGILWVLKSGARWRDLPPDFFSPCVAETSGYAAETWGRNTLKNGA